MTSCFRTFLEPTELNDAILPLGYGILTSNFPEYHVFGLFSNDAIYAVSCMSLNCSLCNLPNTIQFQLKYSKCRRGPWENQMECPTAYKFVICGAVTKKPTTHTSPIYAVARSLTLMQIACKLSSFRLAAKGKWEKSVFSKLGQTSMLAANLSTNIMTQTWLRGL